MATAPMRSEPQRLVLPSTFISGASSICAVADRELKTVPLAIGPDGLVAMLTSQLQVQQDALRKFQQLAAPAADRTIISSRLLQPFRDAVARQQALLPAIAAVINQGDRVQLATLHTQYETAGHPQQVAVFVRDYGISSCQTFEYFRSE